MRPMDPVFFSYKIILNLCYCTCILIYGAVAVRQQCWQSMRRQIWQHVPFISFLSGSIIIVGFIYPLQYGMLHWYFGIILKVQCFIGRVFSQYSSNSITVRLVQLHMPFELPKDPIIAQSLTSHITHHCIPSDVQYFKMYMHFFLNIAHLFDMFT